MNWPQSLLAGRCPVCRRGRIFSSLLRMNERCPHCDIQFEREQGFFSMSIFVGEFLALIAAIPFFLVAWWLDLGRFWLIGLPALGVIAYTPFVFRASRIIWLYIDQRLDPRVPGVDDYRR